MNCRQPVVLLAITSMAAEGTPRMALALCREWLEQGIRPIVVVLRAEPADLAPEFRALCVEYIVLDVQTKGYSRYPTLALSFFRLARRYRATALLSMPLGWHAFMALGARLAGVRRVVAHVGNYPDASVESQFEKFRILIQLGRPLTDKLICCSRYVQRGMVTAFGVREHETAVVYNGVSHPEFESRRDSLEQSATKRDVFAVGMVARLEKHKDHVTLIQAAKILKDRGRSIAVQIVGEGSQRIPLQNLIEKLHLGDTVLMPGMRRDVADVLATFDLFAFSTTPEEGFGIALVEAMLAGVPIVASDVGACREVLDDGQLGLLVPAGNAMVLANAIDAIRADPGAAKMRAHLAHSKAVAEFSARAMAQAYADALGLRPEKPRATNEIQATELVT